jgi:hypothetical protein
MNNTNNQYQQPIMDMYSYNEGYAKACYDMGFKQGYNNGYNNGHIDGKQHGYYEGYEIGKEEGRINTFKSAYDNGHGDGYDEGFETGQSVGYDTGYKKYAEDTNIDYSYLNTININNDNNDNNNDVIFPDIENQCCTYNRDSSSNINTLEPFNFTVSNDWFNNWGDILEGHDSGIVWDDDNDNDNNDNDNNDNDNDNNDSDNNDNNDSDNNNDNNNDVIFPDIENQCCTYNRDSSSNINTLEPFNFTVSNDWFNNWGDILEGHDSGIVWDDDNDNDNNDNDNDDNDNDNDNNDSDNNDNNDSDNNDSDNNDNNDSDNNNDNNNDVIFPDIENQYNVSVWGPDIWYNLHDHIFNVVLDENSEINNCDDIEYDIEEEDIEEDIEDDIEDYIEDDIEDDIEEDIEDDMEEDVEEDIEDDIEDDIEGGNTVISKKIETDFPIYNRENHFIKLIRLAKPPNELHVKLCELFKQIQERYDIHKGIRKNFLSYNYVIHRLLEYMGEYALATKFPLLKSVVKLKEHDRIWKNICDDLGWDFTPGVYVEIFDEELEVSTDCDESYSFNFELDNDDDDDDLASSISSLPSLTSITSEDNNLLCSFVSVDSPRIRGDKVVENVQESISSPAEPLFHPIKKTDSLPKRIKYIGRYRKM